MKLLAEETKASHNPIDPISQPIHASRFIGHLPYRKPATRNPERASQAYANGYTVDHRCISTIRPEIINGKEGDLSLNSPKIGVQAAALRDALRHAAQRGGMSSLGGVASERTVVRDPHGNASTDNESPAQAHRLRGDRGCAQRAPIPSKLM